MPARRRSRRECPRRQRPRRDASGVNGQPIEVAQQAVELFLEFEFWPEGSGIDDEAKLLGVVQEQIDAGAITEANAPTYEDLIDPSIYEEAVELVESTN